MSKSTILGIILLAFATLYLVWQFGRSYGQHETPQRNCNNYYGANQCDTNGELKENIRPVRFYA